MSPAPRLTQTNIRTPLARWRVERGMTQREVAEAAGLTRTVYNRLERGGYKDPPFRRLSNCAIVLGVDVEKLLEPEWRTWWQRQPGDPAEPRDPSALWRHA